MNGKSNMATEAKRAKITPENLEEARKLKALWDNCASHPTQAVFGETYDLGIQANVGHYLNGRSALNLKAANAFARELKCKVSDFSPRLQAELDAYQVAPETHQVVAPASMTVQEAVVPLQPTDPGARYLVMRLGHLLKSLDATDRKSASAILHDLAINPEDAENMARKLVRLLGELPDAAETNNRYGTKN